MVAWLYKYTLKNQIAYFKGENHTVSKSYLKKVAWKQKRQEFGFKESVQAQQLTYREAFVKTGSLSKGGEYKLEEKPKTISLCMCKSYLKIPFEPAIYIYQVILYKNLPKSTSIKLLKEELQTIWMSSDEGWLSSLWHFDYCWTQIMHTEIHDISLINVYTW